MNYEQWVQYHITETSWDGMEDGSRQYTSCESIILRYK